MHNNEKQNFGSPDYHFDNNVNFVSMMIKTFEHIIWKKDQSNINEHNFDYKS